MVASYGEGVNDASAFALTHMKFTFVEVAEHPLRSVTVKETVKHPADAKFAELVSKDEDV